MDAPSTFPVLLDSLLRGVPGRPLVTFYDDDSGERVELSVTTYANWVAKTANLLIDEYLLDAGDTIRLDLPTHWLGPVFLGAAWAAGIAVALDDVPGAQLVVCGPRHEEHRSDDVPVLACSLLPMGVRFAAGLPDGVDDYGALWPGQSDVFAPVAAPDAGTVACRADGHSHTQSEVMTLAGRQATPEPAGYRLLTDVNPLSACGVPAFLAPLLAGGSVVLVAHPDEGRWPARLEDERATAQLRAGAQPSSR